MSREARGQEIRHVDVDGVDVTVTRKRVRNINLRVRSDGSVCMSAPNWVAWPDIVSFAHGRERWIAIHRERALARASSVPVRFSTGETVLVWGLPVTIDVRPDPSLERGRVKLVGDSLVLDVPPSSASEGDEGEVRARLVDSWLAAQLRRVLPGVVTHSEALVGQHANEWRLRRMKTRWGSCSVARRRIWLNVELAQRPPTCLEYVAVHELCHLIEPSHDARFHALMDRYCPDWRATRKRLDAAPPRR